MPSLSRLDSGAVFLRDGVRRQQLDVAAVAGDPGQDIMILWRHLAAAPTNRVRAVASSVHDLLLEQRKVR
jgi:hypothetical protein